MKFSVMVAALLLAACAEVPDPDAQAAAKFARTFPNFHVNRFAPSAVAGVYAIDSDSTTLYYAPASDVVIFGEFWSATTAQPLTGDSVRARVQPRSFGAPTPAQDRFRPTRDRFRREQPRSLLSPT